MNNHIRTLQDLQDNNSQWVETLRQRLLIPELLALPERFAAFSKMADTRFQTSETRIG